MRLTDDDLRDANDLISNLDERSEFYSALYDTTNNAATTNYAFVAKVMNVVVGAFVVSKDVNLDYYISHFHI